MTDTNKQLYVRLFWLQSAARDILRGERVGACCRISVPGRNVEVWGRLDIRKAKYRNVIRCANVWQCPVCANHITAHRRNDLQFVIDKLKDTIPVMISFTVSHKRHDSLSDTLYTLSEAWAGMTSCKCFYAIKKSKAFVGHVRSLEVTWGEANGWHPHYHALFFMREGKAIAGFYDDIRSIWAEQVSSAGGHSSWEHGTALTVTDNSIASYMAKWGREPSGDNLPNLSRWGKAQELTRGAMKSAERGRFTPFEILEQYLINGSVGPAYWGTLFREYADIMRGQRQLTWSRTPDLRKLAELPPEKPGSEVVEGEEAGYVLLAQLTPEQWGAALWSEARGDILDCCARGDILMAYSIVDDCCREHIEHLRKDSKT